MHAMGQRRNTCWSDAMRHSKWDLRRWPRGRLRAGMLSEVIMEAHGNLESSSRKEDLGPYLPKFSDNKIRAIKDEHLYY